MLLARDGPPRRGQRPRAGHPAHDDRCGRGVSCRGGRGVHRRLRGRGDPESLRDLQRQRAVPDPGRGGGAHRCPAGLATGHYARVVAGSDGAMVIAAAVDGDKDQSYMLSMLGPDISPATGVSARRADQARGPRIRRATELPAADAVESQEICFVGPAATGRSWSDIRPGPAISVRSSISTAPRRRTSGVLAVYRRATQGHRVAASEPLYVVGTDPVRNEVRVGPREALATWGLELRPSVPTMRWICRDRSRCASGIGAGRSPGARSSPPTIRGVRSISPNRPPASPGADGERVPVRSSGASRYHRCISPQSGSR